MTLRRNVSLTGCKLDSSLIAQLEKFNAAEPAIQDLIYNQAVKAVAGTVVGPPVVLSENEKALKNYLSCRSQTNTKSILTAKLAETVWDLKYNTLEAFGGDAKKWIRGKIYVAFNNPNSHDYGTLPFEITMDDTGGTSRTLQFSTMSPGNTVRRDDAKLASLEEAIAFITKKLL